MATRSRNIARPSATSRPGLTLVEVVVVLVVMSIAATVVGVALVPRTVDESTELAELVQFSRSTAVRRAETMRLVIAQSGTWTLAGTAPTSERPGTGRLRSRLSQPMAVLFSPFGTCAPDLRTELSTRAVALDPVTCDQPPDRDRRTRGAPRG